MPENAYPYDHKPTNTPDAGALRESLVQAHRLLTILTDVMLLSNTIWDPEEFIQQSLQIICEASQRTIGIAWFIDDAGTKLKYHTHVDVRPIQTEEFVEESKLKQFCVGEGVPGTAWALATPVAVPNIVADPHFTRREVAMRAGLKCTFAIPIRSNDQVIGVFEFFGRKSEQLDDRSLDVLSKVGSYLGTVIQRKDNDVHLSEMQQRQKLLQEQLRATADEAMNSARLKSEFVANVSHEIRTPLAGVMGMAELLATQEGLDAESKEIAEFILTSAHSLLSIVNDLLDFSRLEADKLSLYKTWFAVSDLVAEVERSVSISAAKKGLAVNMRVDDRIPDTVYGDRGRLAQILLNFAHNAVKFTDTGAVNISADFESRFGNIVRVRIAVTDSGIGISPEQQARLFEPFVQADGTTTRKYGGTGLGLSIAKKLAHLMSADIGLDSAAGLGSSFYIIVPLEAELEKLIG